MTDWETIEVPKGAFIGWGDKAGQHVTGMVVEYDPQGGRDFNEKPCPLLTVDLHDSAYSVNKQGETRDFDKGELVNLTIGQAGLKAAVKRADPNPGDLIKITLTGTERTTKGNTVKTFSVQIARAAKSTGGKFGSSEQALPADQPPY